MKEKIICFFYLNIKYVTLGKNPILRCKLCGQYFESMRQINNKTKF